MYLKPGDKAKVVVTDHLIPFNEIVEVVGYTNPLYQKSELRVKWNENYYWIEEKKLEINERSVQNM